MDEVETEQAEQNHGCSCWFQGELLAIAHATHTIYYSQPSRNLDGGPPEHRPFLGFILVLNNPRYILDAGMHCLRVKLIWKLLACGKLLNIMALKCVVPSLLWYSTASLR